MHKASSLNPSQLIETATEVISGVPQIVHRLPLDAGKSEQIAGLDFARIFDRVIIGPTSYPLPLAQAFDSALKKCGVANPNIVFSDIPLRSQK